jgi:hypothetical protein
VRNINSRWQRRQLAKLIWTDDLPDFDNLRVAALDIADRYRAVAGAEVDTNAETNFHSGGLSWLRDTVIF